jgi:5S rRNA maturation endonuclease (ribonuclease M5)
MANSGVVIVISGHDDTQKVFQAIEANLKHVSSQAHETESALSQLEERGTKALEYFGISLGIHETIDLLKEAV